LQDITAHLRGGIPDRDLDALMPYWQVFPAVRAALFESVRPGYSQLRVPAAEIKPSIFGHEEFTAFNATATQIFDKWKKDVIPLHSTLVTLLRKWLPGYASSQPLFPNLRTRKAFTMIRKDLEAAGIQFTTKDGDADFHAAGRHTYITELLRNGTSIVVARELARHSDANMTMR
jgi:hypothetical protein